ncbi:DUF6207 family protein [Streptomyces sp. A5-4]|uniref:DUF6207 family protein n=1 Tax=Streptomyces sp. A5-4 TaxID=3384771 RepID=UPI003DA97555
MGDITTAHLSGPGTGFVEIVAYDEATVRQIADRLSASWASSGTPGSGRSGAYPGRRRSPAGCTWTPPSRRPGSPGYCQRTGCGSSHRPRAAGATA